MRNWQSLEQEEALKNTMMTYYKRLKTSQNRGQKKD